MDTPEATREQVIEPPKFDLESYIANYEGRTRLMRLALIASTSSYLAVDALVIAIEEAKKGSDVNLYLQLCESLKQIQPSHELANQDKAWVERKCKLIKAETDRLEHELKGYKNNLIKESIRMGNEDLGRHYYNIGELPDSFKAYHRMRDYCTSPKHIADMSLRLVLVSIAQRNWLGASSQLSKVENLNLKPEERQLLDPIISAVAGLLSMCSGNFREAANAFLNTSYAFATAEPAAGVVWQKEVLTANDVAVYGGLCALASMDRPTLQKRVLNNAEFRQFLELEPHIRRAISLFCGSKYSACLDILEAYRTDYLLDLYLNPILRKLYSKVRTKSIVQYFIPYSCVSLDEMAKAFQSKEGTPLEEELKQMIQSGALNARIDLVDRLLISPPTSARHTAHAEALAMSKSYEHQLRLRLVRLNMVAAGLEVKDPKKMVGKEALLNEVAAYGDGVDLAAMQRGEGGPGGDRRKGWGGRFGAF